MVIRISLTVVAFVGWFLLQFVGRVAAPLISANSAGQQFENSNAAYAVSQVGLVFNGSGLSIILFFAVLAAIWWMPIKRMIGALLLVGVIGVMPAYAYYDKTDYAEAYFILPNESAFFIPDVGANKDSQAKFGSEEYYESNKVAAKRFQIPHQKFAGSGSWSDYYVPSGRLIIVDRTPYNREWTAANDRGTSKKNESFPCQTTDGLNVTLEMAVSASVFEQDAAKFLYHFGVNAPHGDRKDPSVIFTSVYQGKSLGEVMDGVGRGQVQTLACDALSHFKIDDANQHMADILKDIQAKSKAWFAGYGITIDYLGWAGTFTFDDSVQKAINDRFIAEKVAPVMTTLQTLADVKVKEGMGEGVAKHGLPASLVVLPSNLLDTFSSLLKPSSPTQAASK